MAKIKNLFPCCFLEVYSFKERSAQSGSSKEKVVEHIAETDNVMRLVLQCNNKFAMAKSFDVQNPYGKSLYVLGVIDVIDDKKFQLLPLDKNQKPAEIYYCKLEKLMVAV